LLPLCTAVALLVGGCSIQSIGDPDLETTSTDEASGGGEVLTLLPDASAGVDTGAAGENVRHVPSSDLDAGALAMLRPTEGHEASGVVEFRIAEDASLDIRVELAGLAPGPHGLYVLGSTACPEPDKGAATGSAGDGAESVDGVVVSRLGDIVADERGVAVANFAATAFFLEVAGRVLGHAVIVQPGSGPPSSSARSALDAPVACGVVRSVELAESS
jgi:Cu-Zn family superoxide dismutase